jgi:hypothetical protein
MTHRIHRFWFVALAAVVITTGACLEAPSAPASASVDSLPTFRPPVLDSGMRDGGGMATDAGGDGGMPQPMVDGGMTDDGGMPVDAGPPGIKVLSGMHKLPPAWVVTDPAKLKPFQPKVDGTEALFRVGQRVTLSAPTTSDNTSIAEDRCPNVFNAACSGFAAISDAGATPQAVLVDTFSLLGNTAAAACAEKFNGASLASVSGLWQGRLATDGGTGYSIALSNCAGVGVGPDYVGLVEAPASFDIQNLQAAFPANTVSTVRGVVTAVQNGNTIRTVYLQDPVGGPLSGISIFRSGGLQVGNDAGFPLPAVGDYIQVTATPSTRGDYNQLVLP